MTETLKQRLLAAARAAGFDVARVTTPAAIDALVSQRLQQFLDEGRHGDMAWMATTADRRGHPLNMWPNTRSIIMLGMNYAPQSDPLAALAQPLHGAISCYAQCKDYHDVVKSGLKRVAGLLAAESGAEVKVFVDTAPLMEKPLGEAAGLGWQGKHTNLVSRDFGSWLFLGAILSTAELEPDTAEVDHCGSCRRCLDACPTAAFPAPYQLDARRCIAYLTIEHKGHIPAEFRRPIGNRVFGCDDCLAVCPWNKFAVAAQATRLSALAGAASVPLAELLKLDDVAFRRRFAGTPVKRTGRDRVVRNALIAAGNSRDQALLPLVEDLLDDGSPLVRAMAVWALQQLASTEAWSEARARHGARERDGAVQSEWAAEAR
ncbi:MAG TPA: tRNA epoxyqueuosine(34) reductase QueG [Hyphomicrobiaceae bacterium]|jgi:epoxyqueuosine reductase|nr:tRNA epoxyqueuosine(34) reductase QueG [Hyphomicrobiaceae bacterium]